MTRNSVLLFAVVFCAIGCSGTSRPSRSLPRAIITKVDVSPPRPQIVISTKADFQTLLSFFPNLRQQKETDLAAGWEGKYEIVFHFDDGDQVTVMTSWDDKDWSSGKGDKTLQPGLSEFLDPMFKKE